MSSVSFSTFPSQLRLLLLCADYWLLGGKMQSGEALLETRSGVPLLFSAGVGVALESSGRDDVGRPSTFKGTSF